MTATDVPTSYPIVPLAIVGIISAHVKNAHKRTALTGIWLRLVILRQIARPGTAPSLENAKSIRDADASAAFPQKYCATQAMNSKKLPQPSPRACSQI